MLISYGFVGNMIEDKIALVTGGSTGIGKFIGLQMAKNRAKVAIASRNRSHLATAAAEFEALGLPVLPIPMDVRKKEDIHQAVTAIIAKWGAIHILVNNAGISGLSPINDPDDLRWFNILDTNLNGM
jgi:NAD(P)-dependent dehydrogenase (short-subunit alcohol dehydrogenase family)